jgi:hypothetical protein
MSFDLQKTLASKAAMRKKLSNLSFDEKLELVEAMRDSALAFAENRPIERRSPKIRAALKARELYLQSHQNS